MRSYLEWALNVKPEELSKFKAEIACDYDEGTRAHLDLSRLFGDHRPVATIIIRAAATTAPTYSPDSID